MKEGGFKNIPEILGQASRVTLDSLSKKDPDANAFLTSIDAFSSLITRGLGEKGVLTTQDVQRVIKALPSRFDTVATATKNLQVIRSILDGAKKASIKVYTSPIDQLIQGNSNTQEVLSLDQLKAEKAKRQGRR